MDETKKNFNFTPFAIIGIIIVLIYLAIKPKLNPVTVPTTPAENKVTVENEFSGTREPSADNVSKSDKQFSLTISSPINGSTVNSATIQVKGKTLANAEVFVNEIDGKADSNGNFSIGYLLEEGENYLVVGANDEDGNYKEMELVVNYE